MSTYEKNREKLLSEEMKEYDGQWVAFSRDGTRVLGSAMTLVDLEELLVRGGEDPAQAAYERIEFEDSQLGGADLL